MTTKLSKNYYTSFLAIATLMLSIILAPPIYAATPSFTFDPSLSYIAQGENKEIKIILDTDGVSAAGAGAILRYDPTIISVINITPGTIFADYPTATFDNLSGVARLSGIVSSATNLYTGKGTFGTLIIQGKSQGTALLTFEYQKDSTTESNIAVMYGTGDALAKVGESNIIVTSNSVTPQNTPPQTSNDLPNEITPSPSPKSFKEKVLEFFGVESKEKQTLDAYGPLVSQAPNRNPSTSQPNIVTESKSTVSWPAIGLVIGSIILITLIILFFRHRNKPRHIVKGL